MTKTILFLMAVMLGAFVGLSSPAFAGKGGGGGGQNASSTSSHASTGSQSSNQTKQQPKVIIRAKMNNVFPTSTAK